MIWPSLLEKVYAKVFYSYWNIRKGNPFITLRDLTSFPIVELSLENSTSDWEVLKSKYENKETDILVSITKVQKTYKLQKNGLIRGLFYTLVGMFDLLDREGSKLQLMKFKSSNSETEWNGDYSDYSEKWTKTLRRQVGSQIKKDGEFFITYQDFLKNFRHVIFNLRPAKSTFCRTTSTIRLHVRQINF